MTDPKLARQQLEAAIADELMDHLSNRTSPPGRAQWPPHQLSLNDHPDGPLVLSLDGDLLEVLLEVHVKRRVPPGWYSPPLFAKGDIVMVAGVADRRWVVLDVLGTHADPRPGYKLHPLNKAGQSPTYELGAGTIVPPELAFPASAEEVRAP